MNRRYDDILSRISEAPSWWEEGGVPRFDAFDVNAAGIYTSELALLQIACQFCQTPFVVLVENSAPDRRIAREIRSETLGYGDPPNVGCCDAGLPSNTTTVRVIEYWTRHHPEYVGGGVVTDYFKWQAWRRDEALEVDFPEW